MRHDEASTLVRRGIAGNVRSLREASGQSQSSFASMVGVNRSYLNQIEQGKGNISVDMLVKISDGLDVPIAMLFRGLEEVPPRKLKRESVEYGIMEL